MTRVYAFEWPRPAAGGIELQVDEALVTQLARDGFHEEFGARPYPFGVPRRLPG